MKKLLSLILILCIALQGFCVTAFAAIGDKDLDNALNNTAEFIYKTVKNPEPGSLGGEWAVLGLSRSGYSVPESYYQNYYKAVESCVKACGGILHEKKYTEYSRVIIGLSSIGKDARNVAGYDLTLPLGDYDKTIWQGLNGPIWALIALDSRNYPMPVNKDAKTQATRQMYVDRILSCQLEDGGWNLTDKGGSGNADADITGMVLQALSKYQDQSAVKAATEKALACISKMQAPNGGFSSWNTSNSESCVQIIVALCELGVSLDDSRFVKNGNTVLDNLMTYYIPGKGFAHSFEGSGSNLMASEQGLYALVSLQRACDGKNSLYSMSDAISVSSEASSLVYGLPGKNEAVKLMPVIYPGKSFEDISGANAHKNQAAIEAMASRGIISGKKETSFDPNANMTRAEFATIVVLALGLKPESNNKFSDVPANKWYAPYIGTANSYGIVSGISDTKFNPEGTITRQEAAVMVAKAAMLCGMDTEMNAMSVRDTLAQFSDYLKSSEWARPGLAFCYSADILDQSDIDIQPKTYITRCDVAQMLYNLLSCANLL